MTSPIKNYSGAKGNSGILQWIVNHMPWHRHYFELFAGSAQLYYYKQPALLNTLMDMDSKVISAHKAAHFARHSHSDGGKVANNPLGARFFEGNAITYLRSVQPLLDRSCFIYLDPPYPMASRREPVTMYQYEMTDADHVQLLQTILSIEANVMISTRHNELYGNLLSDWRREKFPTVTHKGIPVTEIIYMNYQPPVYLHQYDNLGGDCWQLQAMKRKRDRFTDKIRALPPYERHMFIQEMIQHDAPAVQHFLSILASPANNDCTSSGAMVPTDETGQPAAQPEISIQESTASLPAPTVETDYTSPPSGDLGVQPEATIPPGSIAGNDCEISKPEAQKKATRKKAATEYIQPSEAPQCHYCTAAIGQPGQVAKGFIDTDLTRYVCNTCKPEHYRQKQLTDYAGMYSEMPVVIPD